MRKIQIALLLSLLALTSCDAISSLIHDDQIVAKVGKHRLYRSEVESIIPPYVSAEDSASLADRYVSGWAADLLFLEAAQQELSAADRDVEDELEAYRRSLLKYRYEQKMISERLDTLITDEQISEFYREHLKSFELPRPVMKVRFIHLLDNAPEHDLMIKYLSSTDPEEVSALESLAYEGAVRYIDSSDQWMDAQLLAREFYMDMADMMALIKHSEISVTSNERGDARIAHIFDIRLSGPAPLEYCRETVRELILNSRKHDLILSLERDLLEDARESGEFTTILTDNEEDK